MATRPTKEKVEMLRGVPLFSRVGQKELRQVAEACEIREIRAGKVLTTQGQVGREFFVVLAGVARCEVDGHQIRTFERGSFFGELALIAGGPRSATVVAETPMALLVLDRRDFTNLLRSSPEFAIKILTSVASRLQDADHQVTN